MMKKSTNRLKMFLIHLWMMILQNNISQKLMIPKILVATIQMIHYNYFVIQVLAHTLAENPISADSPLFSNEPVIKTSLCLQQQQNYPWLHLYYDISNCKARIVLPSWRANREWERSISNDCQFCEEIASLRRSALQKHPHFCQTFDWQPNGQSIIPWVQNNVKTST